MLKHSARASSVLDTAAAAREIREHKSIRARRDLRKTEPAAFTRLD
jgi:hypothetical protein